MSKPDNITRRWPLVSSAVILLLVVLTFPIWGMPWKLNVAKRETRELLERKRDRYEAIIRKIKSLPASQAGELRCCVFSPDLDPSTLREGAYLPDLVDPRGNADGRYLEYYYDESGRLVLKVLAREMGNPMGSFWLLYTDRPTGFNANNAFGMTDRPKDQISDNWWILDQR